MTKHDELPADLVADLQDQLTPVASPLYEGLAHSLAFANKHNGRFTFKEQPHLWSLTTRAELREYYKAHDLPAGWTVAGDPRLMGQLLFINDEHGLELSFLKENRRVHRGGLPPAGPGHTRRRRWASPALFELDGEYVRPQRISLHHAWDYGHDDEGDVDLNSFTTRIVHTTEPGAFGRAVTCNFFFNILPSGELHTTQRFDGDAEEEDFFLKRDANDQ
jgi:hypothetical protein